MLSKDFLIKNFPINKIYDKEYINDRLLLVCKFVYNYIDTTYKNDGFENLRHLMTLYIEHYLFNLYDNDLIELDSKVEFKNTSYIITYIDSFNITREFVFNYKKEKMLQKLKKLNIK